MNKFFKLALFLVVFPFVMLLLMSNEVAKEDKLMIMGGIIGLSIMNRLGFFSVKKVDA